MTALNKDIVYDMIIVGGGNTAAADAILLSRIAKKVIIVHRRDALKATRIYHEPLMNAENVEFKWDSTVTEFLHEDKIAGIKIKNVKTGEESIIDCDGNIKGVKNNAVFNIVS